MDSPAVDDVDSRLWLSITELAARKGKSKQAISKRVDRLLASQAIAIRRDGQKIMVNIVEFDRAVAAHTDPAQALRNPGIDLGLVDTPPASTPSAAGDDASAPAKSRGFLAHKETSAAYKAENDRLDLEERLANLCSRPDVETRTFAVFRRLRDRLLSLPSTCAPRLAHADDERAARMIVDDEVRKLLTALASDLDRADADDDGDGDDLAGMTDNDEEAAGAAQSQ